MFGVATVKHDIDTLLDQLDRVKTLPTDEQEAWVETNLRPIAIEMATWGATVVEAFNAMTIPIVEWWNDNADMIQEGIDKYHAYKEQESE